MNIMQNITLDPYVYIYLKVLLPGFWSYFYYPEFNLNLDRYSNFGENKNENDQITYNLFIPITLQTVAFVSFLLFYIVV